MTPERWQAIEGVYQAARDLTLSDRAAYLQKVCGKDQDLRAEVESLLHHDDSSPDQTLNRPAWLPEAAPARAPGWARTKLKGC